MNSTAESAVTIEPVRAAATPKRVGFSYSLRTLLIVIIGIGVGMGALPYADAMLASVVFTATLATLLLAVLIAGFGAPARRPFWAGFAIFGVAYVVLTMGPWFEEHVAPQLLPERMMDYVNRRLAPPDLNHPNYTLVERNGNWEDCRLLDRSSDGKFEIRYFDVDPPNNTAFVSRNQLIVTKYVVEARHIGSSLLSLFLALVGGWIAAFLARKNRRALELESR